jgi:hypothetical protein
MATTDKNARGSSAQFFVAGELCRRDLVAVVTMGNTPNTDILCSNKEGTKFVHIQVKTFRPKDSKVMVGLKAEIDNGEQFIWVLSGIPEKDETDEFVYYIIPSNILSEQVRNSHKAWHEGTPTNGRTRNSENKQRVVDLPPKVSHTGWSIESYKNRWDIIESLLK